MPDLFDRLALAGLIYGSHESDLYVRDTNEAWAIIEQFPDSRANAKPFRADDGSFERLIDIPFANAAWWREVEARSKEDAFPTIAVSVSGGLVQGVSAKGPQSFRLFVIDYDVEGTADEESVVEVQGAPAILALYTANDADQSEPQEFWDELWKPFE